jgi:nicotinamidase-related amidase
MWQRYYQRWRNVTREHLDPEMLDLVPELAQLAPPAAVFDKAVYAPFFDPAFADMLHEREADALIMTGAETDVCVLATVLGAVDHGFRVVLVTDAVCSSSDAGHDALMTLYRERFSEQIDVADTATVLAEWR